MCPSLLVKSSTLLRRRYCATLYMYISCRNVEQFLEQQATVGSGSRADKMYRYVLVMLYSLIRCRMPS